MLFCDLLNHHMILKGMRGWKA